MTAEVQRTADLWALARGLCLVSSGVVVAISGACWGRSGLAAAATGAALSLANVWMLARFAGGAVAQVAAVGPRVATVRLTSALGAKTVVLFTLVWIVTRGGGLPVLPLALGLLVSVFSLLGAGLAVAARRAE